MMVVGIVILFLIFVSILIKKEDRKEKVERYIGSYRRMSDPKLDEQKNWMMYKRLRLLELATEWQGGRLSEESYNAQLLDIERTSQDFVNSTGVTEEEIERFFKDASFAAKAASS